MHSDGASLGRGDITALGLLYEGSDYALRKLRMYKILKWQGYDGFLDGGHRRLTPTDAMAAKAMVRIHVSPLIWSRCPNASAVRGTAILMINPFTYDKHLKALARPFRFLDFPGEIRNRIYEFLFEKTRFPVVCNDPTKHINRCPPLLQVCSEIRSEATTLSYASTRFHSAFQRLHQEPFEAQNFRQQFIAWIRQHVKKDAKHLRQIQIDLTCRRQSIKKSFGLVLSQDGRLAISFMHQGELYQPGQARKQKHVDCINETCDNARLSNQSLVIALSSSDVL